MNTIHHTHCPVCSSSSISRQLSAKDYTVSQQQFEIWQCASCSLQFTQDGPDAAAAGNFYQSDNYISHTDTNKGFINKLYHFVRKRTLKKKLQLIESATGVKKGSLLDIGAGTGAFVHTAVDAGWTVAGLEPDEATRQRAASLYNVELKDTATLFRLQTVQFDAVTMWHVLEHVHELHAYIEQIKLLLKENGRALIAVPNYTSYDARVYEQYWAAYDVPRHLYHFSPAAINVLLKQHGLRLLTIKPMWFDSFYIAMLSEQYKNGKSNLLKAVWNGLVSNYKAMLNKERCSSVIYIIGK
ncbi:MAG: class I SAM-dependent methyltransferase [Chitinophagaceae bacterium]